MAEIIYFWEMIDKRLDQCELALKKGNYQKAEEFLDMAHRLYDNASEEDFCIPVRLDYLESELSMVQL